MSSKFIMSNTFTDILFKLSYLYKHLL